MPDGRGCPWYEIPDVRSLHYRPAASGKRYGRIQNRVTRCNKLAVTLVERGEAREEGALGERMANRNAAKWSPFQRSIQGKTTIERSADPGGSQRPLTSLAGS